MGLRMVQAFRIFSLLPWRACGIEKNMWHMQMMTLIQISHEIFWTSRCPNSKIGILDRFFFSFDLVKVFRAFRAKNNSSITLIQVTDKTEIYNMYIRTCKIICGKFIWIIRKGYLGDRCNFASLETIFVAAKRRKVSALSAELDF